MNIHDKIVLRITSSVQHYNPSVPFTSVPLLLIASYILNQMQMDLLHTVHESALKA
jgi:hypothetical protein